MACQTARFSVFFSLKSVQMHVNVSHILAGEVGESADFELEGEYTDIPDLELARPLTGRVTVMRLDDGLAVKGRAQVALNLECYRCLEPYEHQSDLELAGSFRLRPTEDDWPISGRGVIDLAPLVREEALVGIPIRQLCRDDCPGLCVECGRPAEGDHGHEVQEPRHTARIKKGQ